MTRKMLIARDCSLDSNGIAVYLDEYGTREEAEKALYEAVIENADYTIKEIEQKPAIINEDFERAIKDMEENYIEINGIS